MKLKKHQSKIKKTLTYKDAYVLGWDTGTGKTIAALEIMQYKGGRWLVAAPPRVIAGWSKESVHFPDLKIAAVHPKVSVDYYKSLKWLTKGKKADMMKEAEETADILIVSHSMIKKYQDIKDIDGLCVDECHCLCGYTTNIYKILHKIRKNVKYYIGLSATPAPNSELDLWVHAEMVKPGQWGTRRHFLLSYAYPITMQKNYNGRNIPIIIGYNLKANAQNHIISMSKEWMEIINKRDCLDLPPLTTIEHWGYMTPAETKKLNDYTHLYKELETDSFNSRLQLAAGRVYIENGVEHVHDARLRLLSEIVESIPGKIIIWYSYKFSINLIIEKLNNYIVVTQDQVENFIKKSEVKCLLAHPLALGTGYDGLQSVCSDMIWYTGTPSYMQWYQAVGRMERQGQVSPMTEHRLRIHHSGDAACWRAIKDKKEIKELLAEYLSGTDIFNESEDT